MNFEIVIGLEVHCELKTNSKMFSASPVTFGQEPNTNVNIVDLGMTGALPVLNKSGVEYALRVCHALNMEIDELVRFDRKNYYYADLPKGFQITQDKYPIGRNGTLEIEVAGNKKIVEIERLHMEEDTTKQLHKDTYSLLNYNRAGIPLIEIVTKPTIRSAQAAAYLEKLRQIFLFTEVSDAKLEEGSMRCDVNVSIRPWGSKEFGTRTEIKNLNSISNVQKAIEVEVARQEKLLLLGDKVVQNTMRYDEQSKQTVVMRAKGDAVDYKYYPEPNILPIRLDHSWVMAIKESLPEMPEQRITKYVNDLNISSVDANILVQSKELSDFFEETIKSTNNITSVVNWLLGDISAYLNKEQVSIVQSKLTPKNLAGLVNFVDDSTISSKQAKKVVEMMLDTGDDPETIIDKNGMKQLSNIDELTNIVNEILDNNPQSIEDFKNGKDRAIGFLVGQVMKATKGQANPGITNKLIKELIVKR